MKHDESNVAPSILLQQVIDMTAAMLDSAQSGQWEVLAEQEAKRREVIEAIFSRDIDPAQTQTVRHAIEAILESDRKTMEIAAEAREKVRGELLQLGRSGRAHKAYTSER